MKLINIKTVYLTAIVLFAGLAFSACSDNDGDYVKRGSLVFDTRDWEPGPGSNSDGTFNVSYTIYAEDINGFNSHDYLLRADLYDSELYFDADFKTGDYIDLTFSSRSGSYTDRIEFKSNADYVYFSSNNASYHRFMQKAMDELVNFGNMNFRISGRIVNYRDQGVSMPFEVSFENKLDLLIRN